MHKHILKSLWQVIVNISSTSHIWTKSLQQPNSKQKNHHKTHKSQPLLPPINQVPKTSNRYYSLSKENCFKNIWGVTFGPSNTNSKLHHCFIAKFARYSRDDLLIIQHDYHFGIFMGKFAGYTRDDLLIIQHDLRG